MLTSNTKTPNRQEVNVTVKWAIVKCAIVLLSLAITSSAKGQNAWRLIDTKPFEGKAVGVVGALGVPTSRLTKNQVSLLAQIQVYDYDAKLRRNKPKVIDWLIRRKIWKPTQRLGIDALIVPTDTQPPRSRQGFGAGNLQFNFQNFTTDVESQIRNFLRSAMPTMIDIYGPPITSPEGTTRTVTIILDEALDALDGGVYNSANDEIRLAEFEPDRGFDWFNLIHQVFHAFRGPLLLSFPSWEEGMARAGALFASVRLRGEGMVELRNFDPKDPVDGDPFWVLPIYDLLNQPPLGNPVFLPESGFQPMAFWRIGMSAGAWLKVIAENQNAFRQFNEVLLSQPDPLSMRGDTVALVDLMSTVVPRVEGMDFRDWYRRQFVLDTGVSVGPKLYVFSVPLNIGVLLVLNHYRTTPTGDEQFLNGLGQLIYRNDQSDDLFAEEGNEVEVIGGEGFIAPQFFNIGGANLIFVDIFINGLALTVPFPYMVRGEEQNENPLWGGVINAVGGQVSIRFNDLSDLQPVNVTRGVFAVSQGLDLRQLYRLRIRHNQEDGAEAIENRNAAFDFYCLMLQGRQSTVQMQVTLPAGVHLFSVPLLPKFTDEAQALGIPADRLLLARWNPTRPGNFRYEFYPLITTPIAPGVGYWLKLTQETNINVEGTPIRPDSPYQIPLFGGYNQVGNPFARDLPISEILVTFSNEQPVDLQTAEQRQWVTRTIWVWDSRRGYQIAQTVRQWQGFWIRSLRPSGVRLVFNFGSRRKKLSTISTTSRSNYVGSKGLLWSVRFTVSTPNSPPDTENLIGVMTGYDSNFSSRIVKPPMVMGTVWSAFESSDNSGEMLAYDFRPNRPMQRWSFVIRSDLPNLATPITLRWDGIKDVPKSIRLSILDLTTNDRFSLRNRSEYTFTAQKGEARIFVVEATQAPTIPLVRILSVQPLRGRGALVKLTLTSPAKVRLEIRSLTGRKVRILPEQFISRLPYATFLWDGRDQFGKTVPQGAYLLHIIATDESGGSQQATRTVMVR